MIKKEIDAISKQMLAELEKVRESFNHSGNKGTKMETVFAEFLKKYLPKRFEIGCGEIIDSKAKRSGQCDIIITNENHPFSFKPGTREPGLFFIEGVSAVGEIKTSLNSKELVNSLKASQKYKELEAVRLKGFYENKPSDDRFIKNPPYFLFAFESKLKFTSIGPKIDKYLKENRLKAESILDGIFVLNEGRIINFGDGQGSLQFIIGGNETQKGFIATDSNQVLFDLLIFLSANIQRSITMDNILLHYLF
ncbi:MAG: DUF6602 domain-containing protein [Candidatus Gracilibacteria bacterium]